MPAMISHDLLARRVLRDPSAPKTPRADAFLIGAQGPDILFFHRVFPWQPGRPTFRLGNALHEMPPDRLIDCLHTLLLQTPAPARPVIHSYILGFLCHYAVDRTVHPYVCCRQRQLRREQPRYARVENLYHHRIESMLDTCLLQKQTGQRAQRMELVTLLPPRDAERERLIGSFYARLLPMALGVSTAGRSFDRLVDDMREALRWMTDRTGAKRTVIRAGERLFHTGTLLSALMRTRPDGYDYANLRHTPWTDAYGRIRTDDFYALCDQAVALTVRLMHGFDAGQSGLQLTDRIDFTGRRANDGR